MTRKFDIQGAHIHRRMAWLLTHAHSHITRAVASPSHKLLQTLEKGTPKLPEVYKKLLKGCSLSKIKMTGMIAIFSAVQLTPDCGEIVFDNYHQIVTIKKTKENNETRRKTVY